MHFLRVADGSSAELETQILIAESKYPTLDFSKTNQLLVEVQKMIGSMLKKLELNARR
jgi:four helix bundle protein